MSNIKTTINLQKYFSNNSGDQYLNSSIECTDFDDAKKMGDEYMKTGNGFSFKIIESTQGEDFLDVFDDNTGENILFDSQNQ